MPQPGQEAGGAEGLGDRRHGWGGGRKVKVQSGANQPC